MSETAESAGQPSLLASEYALSKIRPATLADIDGIYAIETSSFQSPWARSTFPAEIEGRSWSRVMVAECEGHVVGFMIYWIILEEIHLLNLAVDPKWRGRGIGRCMVNHLLDTAALEGQEEVLLEVRRSNQKAQNLYYSLGFEQLGVRRNYYSDNGEDALVMQLKLKKSAKERV